MSLTRKLRRMTLPKLTERDSLALWREVVAVAVASNDYSLTVKVRVLLDLKLRDYADLLQLSDELLQPVYGAEKDHFLAHQLASLIRKYPAFPKLGIDPEAAAHATFMSAEWRCKWVNRRLYAVRHRDSQPYPREREEAKKWIRYVLADRTRRDPEGPTCDFPFSELWDECDFTGGASVGVHGSATHLYAKLTQGYKGGWTVTPRALPMAARAVWENSQMREMFLREKGRTLYSVDERTFIDRFLKSVALTGYNKVGYVPKTAKTHRSIAVEPTLNTLLQKGVDLIMRKRLKRVGLDLSDQVPNQRMAFLGSLHWEDPDSYCTIDLSSASDTLAIMCARDLLPEEWFDVLDSLRPHFRDTDAGPVRYEKFVTMGNGFCFPLQTMIFASLCVAAYAVEGLAPDFRVYGDDIIVRRPVFDKVMELLKFYGFKPNRRKTFSQGPFRESCGADWHNGTNVRPVILDKPLDSLQRVFGIYNQTLRSQCPYVADYFKEVRELLFAKIPEKFRFVSATDPAVVVSGETIDGAFWVAQDVAMASPYVRFNRDTQSLSYVRLQAVPVADARLDQDPLLMEMGALMAALRGGSSTSTFTLRYTEVYRPVIVNPERVYGQAAPARDEPVRQVA